MKSLKITNLKKRFKNINAVNGISLEINEGEKIGIIGIVISRKTKMSSNPEPSDSP